MFNITEQGIPKVRSICEDSCKVRLITIDLETKHCNVAYTGLNSDGIPFIGVEASPRTFTAMGFSITKANDIQRNADTTEISFPDFKGFKVHSTSAHRYTINICFVEDCSIQFVKQNEVLNGIDNKM